MGGDRSPDFATVGGAVLAIVLHWKGLDLTLQCLESLAGQLGPAPQVLVVSNGSSEADKAALREACLVPGRALLCLPANRGFVGGMNAGIQRAIERGFELAWLVSNDAFAEPDCLARLVDAMGRRPDLAAVTPRIVGADGVEQMAGGTIDWDEVVTVAATAAEIPAHAASGTWIIGVAPLVRVEFFRRAGLLDPRFYGYWEEADLFFRMVRAGGELCAAPDAVVRHVGSATFGGTDSPLKRFLLARNFWLCISRNAPPANRMGRLLLHFSREVAIAGACARRGALEPARATLAALLSILLGRYGTPRPAYLPRPLEALLLRHHGLLSGLLRRTARLLARGAAARP